MLNLDKKELARKFRRASNEFLDWLRPESPVDLAVPTQYAHAMTERTRFSSLLSYRDVDPNNNLYFCDDGEPAVGFAFRINPLLSVGPEVETQLEAVYLKLPEYSTIQFGVFSIPQVSEFLDGWASARIRNTDDPVLKQMALRRREYFLQTVSRFSLLPDTHQHARDVRYYMFIRVPYQGDKSSQREGEEFIKDILDTKKSIEGILRAVNILSGDVENAEMKQILREMLNPQLDESARFNDVIENMPMNKELLDKNTHITVLKDGNLGFADGPNEPSVVVTPITLDTYPEELYVYDTINLLGNPLSATDRIVPPFYLYTTITVLDHDTVKEQMTRKMGMLSKQTMSESQWYLSMMGHLFTRKRNTEAYLGQIDTEHRPCRFFTGINLYSHPNDVRGDIESIRSMWRGAGFKCSEEKNIGLPVFMASLPFQYSYKIDEPEKGLQRAILGHSLTAVNACVLQGDWYGTPSFFHISNNREQFGAGPLLISRRGQVASIDLFNTDAGYNFIIVATTGAGKSFFANEIICDILSKGGVARIIDVGRSFLKICELLDGQNLIFNTADPKSINPFDGLTTEEDLFEMMDLLKPLLLQMAFPAKPLSDVDGWEYQIIEAAIIGAWTEKKEHTGLKEVYDWLKAHKHERANMLADQLAPFAIGRYRRWFNGPKQIFMNNRIVVLELEELNTAPDLREVVLAMMIHQITKDMYQSDRSKPKLLLIDEAWDLFGTMKTGKFIETAFRRVRKYKGTAGVITQSFADFSKSDATKAIFANAYWKFVLMQDPTSIEEAFRKDQPMLQGGDPLKKMIYSVKPGKGYSEVYVTSTASGSGLYRFIVDPHTLYTYTTNATDLTMIEKHRKEGSTYAEAIDKCAKEKLKTMFGDASYAK